jgi:hypothetical protein
MTFGRHTPPCCLTITLVPGSSISSVRTILCLNAHHSTEILFGFLDLDDNPASMEGMDEETMSSAGSWQPGGSLRRQRRGTQRIVNIVGTPARC